MSDKYLQPVNNHFAFDSKLEDMDDNEFLNSSFRSNNNRSGENATGNSIRFPANGSERNCLEKDEMEKQQIFAQKRREIESRTLESTQRSLSLLHDSEQVGTSTAVELAKQREQLERTNKNLDDINASLRYSQKHLNGIKSVFGSIRNYFSGSREPTNVPTERKLSIDNKPSYTTEHGKTIEVSPDSKSTVKYEQHPISRLRDDIVGQQSSNVARNNPFENQLESNLNDMCDNLSRLKNLASELGSEIEYQNEMLDNMNDKIEDVDIKISKQNKDIAKLLGKK
ncbi:synaptosomal-associated protein 29kDa [Haematobia irritans]|uniref:synaptosomal-associated protein 29kDa n=1 Tax=Haematobia irritans TaxID=7368 RepID=UPI003F4FF849